MTPRECNRDGCSERIWSRLREVCPRCRLVTDRPAHERERRQREDARPNPGETLRAALSDMRGPARRPTGPWRTRPPRVGYAPSGGLVNVRKKKR